jgi:hypothetical protein
VAVRRSGPSLPAALDWRAVGRGAAAYLAIAVPSGLLIAFAHGGDTVGQESSLWIVALALVVFIAPLVGGAVAGAARPRAPLSHGAVAVSLPAGGYLVIRTVAGLFEGSLTAAQVVSFLLFLMVFTGLGVVGGYLAFRRWAGTV